MKIVFVCGANICRSPLAEAVLRDQLKKRKVEEVTVESAGITNFEGTPRDFMMISYAQKLGYKMGGYARYINRTIVDDADLVICMEFYQVVEVQRRFLPYMKWNRIHRFNKICFDEDTDLMDPTGDTGYFYATTCDRIVEGCNILSWKLYKMLHDGEIYF